MNKKEFLDALEYALRSLNEEVRNDILKDYKEHFEIGAMKGKNEEEIAEELGNVDDIAEEYLSYIKNDSNNDFKVEKRKYNSQDVISSLDNINEIEINVSSADVVIRQGNYDKFYAVYDGSFDDNVRIESFEKDGRLVINTKQNKKNMFFGFISMDQRLEINIPEGYRKNIIIKTISGDIEIEGHIEAEKINIESTSGDCSIGSANAESLCTYSTSGDINAVKMISKDCKLTSISGDIDIEYFEGGLKANSTSGDLEIACGKIAERLELATISGDIDLSIPEEEEFSLSARTLSGDVDVDIPLTNISRRRENKIEAEHVSSLNKIILESMSGDIEIEGRK